MWIIKLIKKIDRTLLILGLLVLIAVIVTLSTGGPQSTLDGLKRSGQLINTVWLRLLLGFTLGGLIQVLIPRAVIAKWLGKTSGLKGILIGSYIGIIMPGGPWVSFPLIASIYKAGAGVGPVIALLTGRAVLSIQMMILWQIPFLGIEIPIAKFIACLLLPPLVGLAGAALFQRIPKLSGTNGNDTNDTGIQKLQDKTDKTRIASKEE
jgi:uncharacterized membrane protein YraQ (UPF0718 family)